MRWNYWVLFILLAFFLFYLNSCDSVNSCGGNYKIDNSYISPISNSKIDVGYPNYVVYLDDVCKGNDNTEFDPTIYKYDLEVSFEIDNRSISVYSNFDQKNFTKYQENTSLKKYSYYVEVGNQIKSSDIDFLPFNGTPKKGTVLIQLFRQRRNSTGGVETIVSHKSAYLDFVYKTPKCTSSHLFSEMGERDILIIKDELPYSTYFLDIDLSKVNNLIKTTGNSYFSISFNDVVYENIGEFNTLNTNTKFSDYYEWVNGSGSWFWDPANINDFPSKLDNTIKSFVTLYGIQTKRVGFFTELPTLNGAIVALGFGSLPIGTLLQKQFIINAGGAQNIYKILDPTLSLYSHFSAFIARLTFHEMMHSTVLHSEIDGKHDQCYSHSCIMLYYSTSQTGWVKNLQNINEVGTDDYPGIINVDGNNSKFTICNHCLSVSYSRKWNW